VDLSGVSEAYSIDDKESLAAGRELFRVEGVFGGSSSGTLLAAALRYCRSRTSPERVVTFVCDTGAKYLSKMYDDFWMADQGLLDRTTAGDLTDLITRRFAEGAVVTTAPTDTLLTVHGLFKLYNVSQLPVVDAGRIVGIVDESDVLLAVVRDAERFADPVSTIMSTGLDTVSPDAPIERLLDIFEREHVPILVADGVFVGLITRIDILNYLRRKLK
jgi:cystathionine beta-synthase